MSVTFPDSPTAGQTFIDGNGTSWQYIGERWVATTYINSFTTLGDTPASYVGAAGRSLKVNQAESGLEFVTDEPAGLSFNVPVVTDGLKVHVILPTEITFPANFVGSFGYAGIAADAATDIDVQKNDVSFGTISFAIGATSPTFVSTVQNFVAGDRLTFAFPLTADATLGQVAIAVARS